VGECSWDAGAGRCEGSRGGGSGGSGDSRSKRRRRLALSTTRMNCFLLAPYLKSTSPSRRAYSVKSFPCPTPGPAWNCADGKQENDGGQ